MAILIGGVCCCMFSTTRARDIGRDIGKKNTSEPGRSPRRLDRHRVALLEHFPAWGHHDGSRQLLSGEKDPKILLGSEIILHDFTHSPSPLLRGPPPDPQSQCWEDILNATQYVATFAEIILHDLTRLVCNIEIGGAGGLTPTLGR